MVDSEEKTMLGAQQKEALFQWLGKVNDTATFKVSPSRNEGREATRLKTDASFFLSFDLSVHRLFRTLHLSLGEA